jgi:hypothetical protein
MTTTPEREKREQLAERRQQIALRLEHLRATGSF